MGLFENRLQLESTVVFLKCFIIIFPYFPRTWPENWGHKPWTTEWTSGHTSSDEKLGTWQITFSGGKMLATKDLWKAPNIEIGRENIGFFLVTFLRSPESGYVFGEICEVVKSKDWSLIEKKLKSSIPIRNSLVIVKTTHPQWTTMVSWLWEAGGLHAPKIWVKFSQIQLSLFGCNQRCGWVYIHFSFDNWYRRDMVRF